MDPEAVEDAICDGGGDKGIDALDLDEDLRDLVLFQSKWHMRPDGMQGDSDLKRLTGCEAYFRTPDSVDELTRSKPRRELLQLLARKRIRQAVDSGLHTSRLVFVTNGVLDLSGKDYVRAMGTAGLQLDVWDLSRLAAVAERTKRRPLRPEKVRLRSASPATVTRLDAAEATMAVGLIGADQLVQLPGIEDLSLFDRNVRLSLGRTRVNREIERTVQNLNEHALFPAYHNGLTMLTTRLLVSGRDIRLEGISVVNGCQSLMALYRNRRDIGDDLRVLVKIVKVDPNSDVADKITHRSNNQNPVDIRDQRSTDPTQRDLHVQVREAYGRELWYAIREGETPPRRLAVLDNQTAAQLLMAVYVREPWTGVRKLRLFDQEYHRIFTHRVTAHRLYFLHRLAKLVDAVRGELDPELQASFAAVRLSLAYLTTRVLMESEAGIQFIDTPERWLPELNDAVDGKLWRIVREVADSVNFHVRAERRDRGDVYDPKVAFKSHEGIERAEREVLRDTRRHAERDPGFLFDLDPIR